jgi:DNA-binding NarL/FixJ family response regulator
MMQPREIIVVTANDALKPLLRTDAGPWSFRHPIVLLDTLEDLNTRLAEHEPELVIIDDSVLEAGMLPVETLVLIESWHKLQVILLSHHIVAPYVQLLVGLRGLDAGNGIYRGSLDQLRADVRWTEYALAQLAEHSAPTQDLLLKKQELQLLQLLADGHSVRRSAHVLGVHERTVYRMRERLRKLFNVKTDAALLVKVGELGLLKTNGDEAG